MKTKLLVAIFTFFILPVSFVLSQKPAYRAWWSESYFKRPQINPKAKLLPLIQVKGNRFVNPQGKEMLFRGVSISDPDKIEHQGHWNKEHFMKVKEFGASVVRIPIHPIAWRERTPEKYLELLDQAVDWCTDLNLYIIIDWHSIGNLKMELFQDPMYDTTPKETFQFWRTIAQHFIGNNTVAFYELFNEPTTYFNQLGAVRWEEWKQTMEDLITLIRGYDKETIPLVAGFDWAYDLTPLLISPINAEGIGYVTHPYAQKRSRPWEPKWEENFGFASGRWPIIATEIGFSMGREGFQQNDDYGKLIVNYLESKNISWVAWVFDPEWWPKLFKSWDTYELTESGKFFKEAMQPKEQKN